MQVRTYNKNLLLQSMSCVTLKGWLVILNVNEFPTIMCSHVVQRFPPHCETVLWVLFVNLDLTNSCLSLVGVFYPE